MMKPADVLKLPRPRADLRIAYGDGPHQFGDLRLPSGSGPFPLAVVIHGGCWEAEIPLDHLSSFCAALAETGIASWNVEYRGLGTPGGGWPGTFLDVATAVERLPGLMRQCPIDDSRVLLVGHSAGGHLALWLGARHGLPSGHELRGRGALVASGVLALAGLTDLSGDVDLGTCGAMVPKLLRGTAGSRPARLDEASPVHMAPPAVPVLLMTGRHDAVVPAAQALAYLRTAGGRASRIELADAGHFELVTPKTPAFSAVLRELRKMLHTESK